MFSMFEISGNICMVTICGFSHNIDPDFINASLENFLILWKFEDDDDLKSCSGTL